MAITREEIIRAAEAIEQTGEKPTMASVREHLGGGSFATISPVLREWRDGRTISKAIVLDMPGELKTVMERQASEFWQAASALANEKLMTVQREAESAVSDAHNERDETLQEVTRLEEALSSANQQQEAARNSEVETGKKNLNLKEDLIRLQEQLSHSKIEAEQLRADLRKVTLDKERNADEASHLHGLNEQLKKELAEAKTQADTQRQEATENRVEANNLKNQLERSIADQERQKASLEQHQEEALTLKTSVAKLEANLEDRTGKVTQLEAELTTLRKDKQEDTQQLAKANAERDAAKTRISDLSTDCEKLRQENKSLLLLNVTQKKKDHDQNQHRND